MLTSGSGSSLDTVDRHHRVSTALVFLEAAVMFVVMAFGSWGLLPPNPESRDAKLAPTVVAVIWANHATALRVALWTLGILGCLLLTHVAVIYTWRRKGQW